MASRVVRPRLTTSSGVTESLATAVRSVAVAVPTVAGPPRVIAPAIVRVTSAFIRFTVDPLSSAARIPLRGKAVRYRTTTSQNGSRWL